MLRLKEYDEVLKLSQMMRSIKHIPMRTCIGCGKLRPKQELIRLVRTDNGNIDIDNTGKIGGRGAYLCPVTDCWLMALKRNNIERKLHVQPGHDSAHKGHQPERLGEKQPREHEALRESQEPDQRLCAEDPDQTAQSPNAQRGAWTIQGPESAFLCREFKPRVAQ